MNNNYFSIIIPCFNCEKYIEQCINSIISQDYKNYEIIIVDDGSSDNSVSKAMKYKNEHSNISIISQENKGGILARKKGIEKAKGDYILLMDADDWIQNDTLKMLNYYINFYNKPDVIKYRYIEEPSGNISELYLDFENNNTIIEEEKIKDVWNLLIYTDKYNSIWSCIFKKELFDFDNCIYNHIVRKGEDLEINLQLIQKANRIAILTDVFYHYRNNPYGITQNVTPEKMVRNCTDRLYLTKTRIALYKEKYNDCNESAIWNNYASLLVSQLVKVLRRKETKYDDIMYIKNSFEKIELIKQLKKVNIKEINYRGSNSINRIILNNILKNILNNKIEKNYKYKMFFYIYYKYISKIKGKKDA